MRVRTERDEAGAIIVMAVLLMTGLLTFTAFAVDLGTQRVARRDMQSLADATAMDLARQIKGRSAATVLADPRWTQVKDQAAQQNKTVGRTPTLTPVLGAVDNVTGVFTPVSGSAVPTAVKVIASTSVAFAFVPGDGNAARTAVATSADPLLCFSVSPSALTVNSTTGALAPLLDNILKVNLGVATPAGLLDVRGVQVPLADIAVELGAATPQALVNLSNVSLRTFTLASATALSKNGYVAQASALQAIALQMTGGFVDVGRILSLETANAAGLASKIDVFDIVTAAVFASNGTNAINVKNLGLTVPGVGGVQEFTAVVTEPPQIACGKAGITAKSAQVKVHLKSAIDPLSVGATDVNLEMDVDLGRGEGTLSSLACSTAASGGATAVIRAKTGAALVSGPSSPDRLGLLSLRVVRSILFIPTVLAVKTQIGAAAAQGGPVDLSFAIPAGGTAASQSVSGSNVLALQTKGTTVTLLDGSVIGGLTGGLLTALIGGIVDDVVSPVVSGPVNSLLSTLLYPVLAVLGVKVAQTDVTVQGKADCATVKLVG